MPHPDQRAERTFRYDLLRGGCSGIIQEGWVTFTLLVAIHHFHASEKLKAVFVAAPSLGLLLTPLSVFVVSRRRMRPSTACAIYFCCTAILTSAVGFAPGLVSFSLLFVIASIIGPQQTAMNTEIYSQNYLADVRGQRIAISFITYALLGAVFGYLGGRLLDHDLAAGYPVVYLIMAAAAGVAAFAYTRMPTERLIRPKSGNPLQHLDLIRKDRLFGYLLLSWMVLGLGNLMSWPIRTEYIGNPAYGIEATNTQTGIVIIVIPLVARVLSARAWGLVFDRFSLITTRNLLNVCFIASILVYFTTSNLYVMGLGSALFGLALGGGSIIWQLWVTKIADAEKVSAYMSVHTACCGVRGMLAPFIGYAALHIGGVRLVAFIGAGLIVVATLLFGLVRRHPRIL